MIIPNWRLAIWAVLDIVVSVSFEFFMSKWTITGDLVYAIIAMYQIPIVLCVPNMQVKKLFRNIAELVLSAMAYHVVAVLFGAPFIQ